MSNRDQQIKRLHTAFKLSGLLVRRELCRVIVDKFNEVNIDLFSDHFDAYIKRICDSLEKQCSSNKSIENSNIEQAVEVCLHSGRDENETIFSVINAFDFPKLSYNMDRKMYFLCTTKPQLLSDANSRTQMFLDRYTTVFQRTQRIFKNSQLGETEHPQLQTVDYLLTSSQVKLHRTLILGSLLQVRDGYYLEDPTGMVQLDLEHAKYRGRYFVENMFVLVNGYYEDKILHVSTMSTPPAEKYAESRVLFNNINYFGGQSSTPLKDSKNLHQQLLKNQGAMYFFSDVWLDNALIFEKLDMLFQGLQESSPIAVVFMGNFIEEQNGLEKMNDLKKLFKQLGELMAQYPTLINTCQFVFVPGMSDPSSPHLVPRIALPKYITEDFRKLIPNAIFATNPCRIQYCTKEIVIFRADIVAKLIQGTIHRNYMENEKEMDIAGCVTQIIIGQGHLCPLSLNSITVHWDFDYTLRLYPLPDLVVIGDKSDAYDRMHKDCNILNPGSFCENGFAFRCYEPRSGLITECNL